MVSLPPSTRHCSALKGDFTRTGVRTKRGALDDGVNSIQRYYLNNFIDADRQEGMDLLVGSSEFNDYPSEHDEMARIFLLQELADDRRRGYDKNHIPIKFKSDEHKLNLSWLPGDLRHHMRVEALQSRSPLSSAATEEELCNAKRSSDFLLEVSSSSAVQRTNANRASFEVLRSIDNRVASGKPWWVGNSNDQLTDGIETNLSIEQRPRLAAMLLLAKAPVFTAAVLVTLIALL